MTQRKWYLSPRLRQRTAEILRLHRTGMKQVEIADRLGIDHSTVSVRLRDALAGATSFDELEERIGAEDLQEALHVVVANIMDLDDLEDRSAKLKQAVDDFSTRLRTLGEEQPTGAKAYVADLTTPRRRGPTAASKELRSRSPAGEYVADLIERK